jgi:tight adherence protein B
VLIAIATFVLVVTVITGSYWAFILRPEALAQSTVRKRLKAGTIHARAVRAGVLKNEQPLSSVSAFNTVLSKSDRLVGPLQRLIDQSGLRLTIGVFLLQCGCAALLVFLLVTFFTSKPWVALIAAALAGAVPYLRVKRARTKRMRKFEEQFPEAIDLIARALRAGHAFPTGLAMVAEELPDPVGAEFKLLYDRQNFGMPLPEALKSFAERIPVLDARFFVTAVLTQREAGGNLSEVLDNLGSVIRERFKVKRQVRVLSAHGRITGWVLAGMPPVLAVAFSIIAPKHIQTLINDPLGVNMIIGALFLQVAGTFFIRRIVNIEY